MKTINRRDFLKTASAFSLGSMLSAAAMPQFAHAKTRADDPRPNIIFILADDLGFGDLKCYGNPRMFTPALDKLARQGRLFTQFYVNAPVCSPTRAAIMTGRFPGEIGVHGAISSVEYNEKNGTVNYVDPSLPTLPRLLKESGYRTGHYGKWHLSHSFIKDAPTPEQYGIDEYRIADKDFPIFSPKHRPESTKMVMDETWSFIERNQDKPFFVNAWLADTHAVLNPSEEQMDRYKGIWWAQTHTEHDGAARVYYGTVTEMDKQIGLFLDKLEQAGLADNTIVVFTSDNGPEDILIGEASHSGIGSTGPCRGRKRSIYEGGVRVPFIIRWPGKVKPDTVDDSSVISGVDMLPTFAALAGIDTSHISELGGEDASAIFHSKLFDRTKPLFWEYRFLLLSHPVDKPPMLAIRDGRYKLLINPDMSRVELYDIPSDPSELNNIAEDNFEIVQKLAQKLLTWRKTLPEGPVDPSAGTNAWNMPTAK